MMTYVKEFVAPPEMLYARSDKQKRRAARLNLRGVGVLILPSSSAELLLFASLGAEDLVER